MFFYIDESGHTGANLFDPDQPMLYYGAVSSRSNLDLLAEPYLAKLRAELETTRLHASELGNKRLVRAVPVLSKLQKRYDIRFDLYRVAKADHALISFFDQVFDQGLNPAVTWTGYWTPMRYVLLLKVASLFDEEVLKQAWNARINTNSEEAETDLIEVCGKLLSRVRRLPDARARQVIGDALEWAKKHPSKINYNVKRKSDLLQITPNVIGFQTVMHGIANRLGKSRKLAPKASLKPHIVVDQQSQFNRAQRTLSQQFAMLRDLHLVNGVGLPDLDFRNMPDVPIHFRSSSDSAGLELVDIYLWIFKRRLEEKELASELSLLMRPQINRGRFDEISINAIAERWTRWFDGLPGLTDESMERAKKLMAIDEERRLNAISSDD